MSSLETHQKRLPEGYHLHRWVSGAGTSYLVEHHASGKWIVQGQKTPKQAVDMALPMIEMGAQ